MKVRELITRLQALPDQDATIVIADGKGENVWLIVSGVIERKITRSPTNPDFAVFGSEPAVEIA